MGEEISGRAVSYVADFKSKSLSVETNELIGGINMMDDDNLGLYLNERKSAVSNPSYNTEYDYLDVNNLKWARKKFTEVQPNILICWYIRA